MLSVTVEMSMNALRLVRQQVLVGLQEKVMKLLIMVVLGNFLEMAASSGVMPRLRQEEAQRKLQLQLMPHLVEQVVKQNGV